MEISSYTNSGLCKRLTYVLAEAIYTLENFGTSKRLLTVLVNAICGENFVHSG